MYHCDRKIALEIEICLLIISKIADVGNPKTPPSLASANVGNGGYPSPPKACRRLKWMVPYMDFMLEIEKKKIVNCLASIPHRFNGLTQSVQLMLSKEN
jgi:hypothetical protein